MATTSKDLVERASARIGDLAPPDVEAHLLVQDSTLIDVREPEELLEHGRIAGALPVAGLANWHDIADARR